MQTHEIRRRFLDHFVRAGHTEVPSASLVLDDPNLLFVNAGMVPFKPYFLGQETPPYATATSIQKCVRTLDIEEVGITTRHNTFFQMAGNFSFGDYFKEGAIRHAWSLLTSSLDDGGFGIDPALLWVTVYLDDDEAYGIWRDVIGVPEERIQRRGMADNYWSMGVPGPCGPCSEIFYDRGPAYGVDGGPEADEDRYIEIWNLVFMQNERGDGSGKDSFEILGPLPKQNIDTGMGVERVAFLLQGVENVYETDLLRPVIDTAERLSGAKYGADSASDVRFRVIADHARTAYMLISDGVTPGNEGRGYILRRLLRRIVRSVRLLGATGETMAEFMATVRDAIGPSFPETVSGYERIERIAVAEEAAFLKTLESGTQLFERAAESARRSGAAVLSGQQAFALHDTHGFPIDLTLEMASEAGLQVDEEGFRSLMSEQRARAKADSQAKKHAHADLSVYRDFLDAGETVFTGFTDLTDESRLLGIVSGGRAVAVAREGDEVEFVLDRTPFYAESGGQLGDRGMISTAGFQMRVDDVQKIGKKLWIHKGVLTGGEVEAGQIVTAAVDPEWRKGATQGHSATHLVHAALRQILGPEAVQAGSLNKPGYMRFDFNWSGSIPADVLAQIEEVTNSAVDADYGVNTIETTLDEAKRMGAMALFGENYGSTVRVVEIGGPFSMELCGGTHVSSSAQIGPVSLLGEASVGSGIRRVEAYVGMDAYRHQARERALVSGLATSLKAPADELPDRIAALTAKLRETEKALESLRAAQLASQAGDLLASAEDLDGVRFLAHSAPGGAAGDLRTLASDLKGRLGSDAGVVLLTAPGQDKVPFVIAVTPAAQERGLRAGDLVKAISPALGARGGGKADMAQGAGTEPGGIDAAVSALRDAVRDAG
ncbi:MULTISPECIES: alanine--tRNA ligase [Dietzia]|uniref:Alanine--tRNA ligase n=2 Tax=Dietzia TaxID=37914 RepID=A0A4V2W8F9_9ACTN|nr:MULTISPECIES: alanine--tRNA ligase [Dietzia]MCT1711900.1 alanine--tRNA ligase [Dietzia cinnamea]MCT1862637.1 alanine--tRNA ligase [Dietzia cinnamea]MCT1884189.1 alanine--tRNA ligase [Dietzia cinnamea]MCT2028959.1 alanine--tRNA ligase [Dietzia cinnamea]MCT2032471.1 alanine--tRNA ligase [Dietzia cinnamea]